MTADRNQSTDSIGQGDRSNLRPNWAYRMTWIAFLITASPAWLTGLERIAYQYGLLTTPVQSYTAGEVWLSTLVAELFILVVWRNRNRPYHIR